MTQQRETLKAKLLAEAEQAIEAMLKQLLDDEAMSQSAMEQIAGNLEERLGRATVQPCWTSKLRGQVRRSCVQVVALECSDAASAANS